MRPVVPAPSADVLALAGGIVAEPDVRPRADDPELQRAARRVARELDADDRRMIAAVAGQPDDGPLRAGLTQAVARRIVAARLTAAAERAGAE